MRSAALALGLLFAGACSRQVEVSRPDWPVVRPSEQIFVQTHAGVSYDLTAFRFTTQGLVAWRGDQIAPTKERLLDTLRVPLDAIAVVRVRELDRAKTLALASGVIVAGLILIAETRSDERPEALPPPVASCPFIYSFNGREYVFDSETYSGAVSRGLERSDVDNLDHLRPADGKYRIMLTDERPESQYTDAVTLLVADHPVGTRVAPDATGGTHIVGRGTHPVNLTPFGGATLPARAGWEASVIRPAADSVALLVTARNTALAPFVLDNLITLMGRDVYSWYASLTNEGPRRRVRDWILAEGALEVSVGTGPDWTRVARLPDVGPWISKVQVVPLRVPGAAGDTLRIRLESSPGLWETPGVELVPYHGPARVEELTPVSATTAEGRDVRELLEAVDGRYHVATMGSRVAIEFRAPPSPAGRTLTTLVRTTGHYYLNSDDRGTPQPDVVGRIMSDRGFAQSYFLARWVEATSKSVRR